MVDLNSGVVPIDLYGAALAGVPFVPVNYRLTDDQRARSSSVRHPRSSSPARG